MTESVKETITTQSDTGNTVATNKPTEVNQVEVNATGSQTAQYLIYFFFGLLETLLVFRLVLKLMGASISSAFVGLIYGLTGLFILPFEGIFRRGFTQGLEATSILEPSTLVAIIVYAVLAWGIVKLAQVLSGKQQTS